MNEAFSIYTFCYRLVLSSKPELSTGICETKAVCGDQSYYINKNFEKTGLSVENKSESILRLIYPKSLLRPNCTVFWAWKAFVIITKPHCCSVKLMVLEKMV